MTSSAHLQVEIDSSVLQTVATTLQNRPKNTKRKYDLYQAEFLRWCDDKGFSDQGTVTSGKLHLFLSDKVVGRASKKNAKHVIGYSTVCGYANAIVDLYNQQSNLRMNSHPHPRDASVKQLMRNVQKDTTDTRRKNYVDRGIGSLLDGYQSTEQFTAISMQFMTLNDTRGRACFLLSHYGLLRGENIRDLELADMLSQVLDGEGFSESIALVLLIQHGKTNQFGKLQHVGYMRNKEVKTCPIGATALYLFERFHVDNEIFPDMRASEHWYDIKFLRGRNKLKSMSYEVHKKSFETVFQTLGLCFNKKTHINRQQGVRELENADVDVSQTRRHGRWGVDSCEGIYSAPLAREAMRGLSGHPAKERLYYIPRSIETPPIELQKRIFPQADGLLEKVVAGDGYERNLAARGFLELLIYLRRVLLQDSAILMKESPTCKLWSHPMFSSEEFQTFQNDLLHKIDTAESPTELRLQQALPLLSAQLVAQHTSLTGELRRVQESVAKSQELLHRVLGGEMRVRFCGENGGSFVSPSFPQSTDTHTSPVANESVQSDVRSLTMSRGLLRVSELWAEWYTGLGHRPSIVELDRLYGTKWRNSSSESKFYSRRKVIINHVNSIMSTRSLDANAAIQVAEVQQGTMSLDAYSKSLSWMRNTAGSHLT